MNINGILIDYGGTLDTGGHHWYCVFAKQYASAGITVDEALLRAAYIHAERQLEQHSGLVKATNTFKDVLQEKIACQFDYLSQHCRDFRAGLSEQEQLIAVCDDFARQKVQESVQVLALLSGKYPLVLVSNFYGNIQTVIKEYGIADYFQTIIESARVGIRKPNPGIFRLGIQYLNIPAQEILVIGDSFKNDIAPAQLLGCKTVWLKGRGWDTEEDSTDRKFADIIISNIEELTKILI
ncbi:MAG: HAD family hydrolase [Prevotellaceae bacterium]|jgi:putative hydrolase of the HAD superfamily|nr:HAD family hydrolase [Prevotellaceae bacterium]